MPLAVLPAKLTSEEVNPVTGSLNWTPKVIGELPVGSAWLAPWLMIAVGGVVSMVRVGPVTGVLATDGATTTPLNSCRARVPLPVLPVTGTVQARPRPGGVAAAPDARPPRT